MFGFSTVIHIRMNILEWNGDLNRAVSDNQLDIMTCSMIAMVSYDDLLIRKATRHFRKLIAAPILHLKKAVSESVSCMNAGHISAFKVNENANLLMMLLLTTINILQ